MNHFDCFKNARNVVVEMLEDRGFIVNDEYKNVDDETLKYLYYIKSYDIFCKEHVKDNTKIYAKFIYTAKIKPTIFKEYITTLFSETLNPEQDKIILILQENPSKTLVKIAASFKNCEIFNINNLQINITKHSLVPKHSLISETEVNELTEKYNLSSIYQLPVISRQDPIVRYYNFPSNRVCKIVRYSKTSVEHIFYRYIK